MYLPRAATWIFSSSLLFVVCLEAKQHFEYVTCGSVIKLLNPTNEVRLHSHDIKYGSGSGQQSVTGVQNMDDNNSHWAIKGIPGQPCKRGKPIKCGSLLRLEHAASGCNLHSHIFQSPLSQQQEVSCFGKGGEGDTGDFWVVNCDGESWERDEEVQFKHQDTGTFLAATGNRFGRPINGQREICAQSSLSRSTNWRAAEGVFIKPTEMDL